MWAPITKRLGRRGAALLLTGALWLLIAWGVAVMPIPTTRARAPHEYAPIPLRIAGWAVAGALAIIFAFIWQDYKSKDGTSKLDRIAFALLIIMPVERAISWGVVLILGIPGIPDLIPLPPVGIAWAQFAVWLVVCLHTSLINGWQEPITPPEVTELGGA